jgi:glycolate oxidase FAD binding subunit
MGDPVKVGEAPATREELAQLLLAAGAAGEPVRFTAGGTKLRWAADGGASPTEVSLTGLDRIVEHNAGDLTAIVEAGTPLASLQAALAEEGQMLALDPPDGGATLGGVIASGDSGPLRSRYGGGRDLILGVRVALSDGSLAKSGGRVIKNVAGYDLAKLFGGSFGSLGAIVELAVRLHPLPTETATAVGTSTEPDELGRALVALLHAPLEHHGLDVRVSAGEGALLVRFAGAAPRPQAEAAEKLLREAGLDTRVDDDDEALWQAQRDSQRASAETDTIVRVSGLPTQLPTLFRIAARAGGELVGRGPLGLFWLRLPGLSSEGVAGLRRELAPSPCALLDRPNTLRADPWPEVEPSLLTLMRRIKQRFDPAGICNPGAFAGGL